MSQKFILWANCCPAVPRCIDNWTILLQMGNESDKSVTKVRQHFWGIWTVNTRAYSHPASTQLDRSERSKGWKHLQLKLQKFLVVCLTLYLLAILVMRYLWPAPCRYHQFNWIMAQATPFRYLKLMLKRVRFKRRISQKLQKSSSEFARKSVALVFKRRAFT